VARVVDLEQHLLRCHLRVGQGLGEVLHFAARHARGVEQGDPVVAGCLAHPRIDQRLELGAAAEPLGVAGVAGIVEQRLEVEGSEELAHHRIVAGGDRNLAVGRLEEAVGGDERVAVAGAHRQFAGGEVFAAEKRHEGENTVQKGGLDVLALAVQVAGAQGADDAEGGIEAADEVGDRLARAQRRLALLAVDAHEAAHRLDDEVEGRKLGHGAGAAVAVDAGGHQPRVQGIEPGPIEAHLRQDARAEILDQHVGFPDQLGQECPALVAIEIEGHRLLVAIEGGEEPAQPFHQRALLAHRVTLAGWFDLDDLRPHVAEQHRAEGP